MWYRWKPEEGKWTKWHKSVANSDARSVCNRWYYPISSDAVEWRKHKPRKNVCKRCLLILSLGKKDK